MKTPGLIDEDGFSRRDVAQHRKAEGLQRDRLARDDILGAAHRLADADDERADAEGIAKRDQPAAGDQGHDRIGAAAAPVYACHRREDGFGVESRVMRSAFELQRQHIQQTSESELVLTWRKSSWKSSRFSASLFVRLPLCASVMPNGELT